ncbi:MAG: zinc ABC transporter substrate-binding protein [Pseudomonadota bacterium]
MVLGPSGAARASTAPLKVVCTTGMIGDAARAIAGERATVEQLMGSGIDPHAYRQTRTDIKSLVQSDLVLWNGLYLEAQMEEFLLQLGEKQSVVAVAEQVPEDLLIAHDDYEGRFDPHLWMDPARWARVVRAVADALVAADPGGADAYREGEAAYAAEVEAVGAYALEVLGSVPEPARVLISAHDAFNYFGDAYGYEVLGIQGISTESEAGLRRIEELVDLLVERKIPAVFIESSVSDRNVKALIEGAGAAGQPVTIGGELFSDAMGAPGTYEGTYPGMIDHNATLIARALGGEAPASGLHGKLGGAA